MKLLSWVSFFAPPMLLVFAEAEAPEPPSELLIETTYMPDECTVKSELYEKIEVHYVRPSRGERLIHRSDANFF